MKRLLIGVVAMLLSADALVAVPIRKASALRTVTTNGVEWTYEIVGGTVVLGRRSGSFLCRRGQKALAVPENTVGELVIPCVLDGKTVRCIGGGAFSGCKGLTSVTIPPGVAFIGEGAFRGCSELKSVTIPPSVTSIASDAFAETPFFDNMPEGMVILGGGLLLKYKGNCPSTVTIPDGVMSISKGAFRNCHKMVSVSIPSSVTNIEDYAFSGCSNLASVTIPPSVTSIRSAAFIGCRGLESVTISEGVAFIEKDAFKGCLGLGTVKIPRSVTSIGSDAFWGALKSFEVDRGNAVYSSTNGLLCSKDGRTLIRGVNGNVIIPSCVTNIASGAFNGCSGLESVTIPSSVMVIGGSALVGELGQKDEFRRLVELASAGRDGPNPVFGGCSGLRSFAVDEANTAYSSRNGLLCSKDGQTLICGVNGDVIIPPGVTNIGRSAFYGYNGLKSVKIPPSLTRIEERAFYGSWLESLTIPSTVTNIDCRAFVLCPNLKSIDVVRNGKIERESAADFFRRFGFNEQQQREADKADQRRRFQAIQAELKRVQEANDASGDKRPKSGQQ